MLSDLLLNILYNWTINWHIEVCIYTQVWVYRVVYPTICMLILKTVIWVGGNSFRETPNDATRGWTVVLG